MAKELYRVHPEIKKVLMGGAIWAAGYYINTVDNMGMRLFGNGDLGRSGRERDCILFT